MEKHRNSRLYSQEIPRLVAAILQFINRVNRLSAVSKGCLLAADALFSIDIVTYTILNQIIVGGLTFILRTKVFSVKSIEDKNKN